MKGSSASWRMLRPSPATVIATIALVVASAGIARAGSSIVGSNHRAAASGTPFITGTNVLDNSLKGADIDESSLSQVPSAGSASKLGGYAGNELLRAARGTGGSGFTAVTGTFASSGGIATIVAPRAGFIIAHGIASWYPPSSGCPCLGEARLFDTDTAEASRSQFQSMESPSYPDHYETVALSWVFTVNAGTHHIAYQARNYNGSGSYGPFDGVVDAVFIPFGSSGGSTLGAPVTPARSGPRPGK